MKQNIFLSVVAISFIACGGGNKGESTTDILKKREFVVIAHNIPLEECKLDQVKSNIDGAVFGDIGEFHQEINKKTVAVSAEKSNVNCEKYNKSNDDITCSIVDFQEAEGTSCAVGFNFIN